MSKSYIEVKKENDNFANVLFVFILLLVCAPVIPISFIFLFILYLFKAHGKKYVALSGGLLAVAFLFFNSAFVRFMYDSLSVFKLNMESINTGNLLSVFSNYGVYNFRSFSVVLLISFFTATIMLQKLNYNQMREQAGITNLDKEIKKIDKHNKLVSADKVSKDKTLLGRNQSGNKIYCADNAKHVFVSGTTGSGKTVLLSNFVKRAMEKDYGLLLVDGKGDTGKNSLLEITKGFCNQYNKKLYVVNMNAPETSCCYNPFQNTNATICKDMLINMSDWSEEHYKANTERYLQRVIKMMKLADIPLSFEFITEYIQSETFEQLSADLEKDNVITKDEHMQNLRLIDSNKKIIQGAAARFSTLAEGEMGEIFSADGIDIQTALQENAVILFILNPLLYPETSTALGKLILIDSKKAVSQMFQETEKKRKFFVFDEINVYASKALLDLINKSRSADVTCICATQSLSDLQSNVDEAFQEQIIENCNNYVVMRQNSVTSAQTWAETVGTKEAMQMTYQITDTSDSIDKGSARKTRKFKIHPDNIKSLKTGEGYFISRDTGCCEKIFVEKPF